MKLNFLLAFLFTVNILAAQTTFRTKFSEGHFTYMLNSSVDFNSVRTNVPQFAAGLNVNVGTEHISSVLEYDFTRMNLKKINSGEKYVNNHEFYLGIRYYPMKPTFLMGRTAVRLTLAACGGLDLEPNWRAMFMGGFMLSPVLNTSGIGVYFVYKPGKFPVKGFIQYPVYGIRLTAVIGVSAE